MGGEGVGTRARRGEGGLRERGKGWGQGVGRKRRNKTQNAACNGAPPPLFSPSLPHPIYIFCAIRAAMLFMELYTLPGGVPRMSAHRASRATWMLEKAPKMCTLLSATTMRTRVAFSMACFVFPDCSGRGRAWVWEGVRRARGPSGAPHGAEAKHTHLPRNAPNRA